jgi:hypothetical protein
LVTNLIFYVDHMALVYLVNKPQVYGRIIKWLLLFLEYDFKIAYKLGRSHLMANALNKLSNQAKLVDVPCQTINVHLFSL